jgi:TolA-binding protein
MLCAGYYALAGQPDEAAVMFNVLKNRIRSPLAQEAAYKVAIVWMKAGQTDLAKKAVEEYAERYAASPRTVDLYLRLARHLFEQKQYKSAIAVSTQVQTEFSERPEAAEAAFIIALCYRETDNLDRAIEALKALAVTAERVRNGLLACEAWFEIARIQQDKQQKIEEAMTHYRRAADASRSPITERQQQILEHSLYQVAEYEYRAERWSAALDLFLQLRSVGSKMNLLGRILNCRSRLDEKGLASLGSESADEKRFLKDRIAANPGSILALQADVQLLDGELEGVRVNPGSLTQLTKLIEGYHGLLKKYAPAVLAQLDMGIYIRVRIGSVASLVSDIAMAADHTAIWRDGLTQFETALRDAPESLHKTEILEGIAVLAERVGESRKAFDAYQELYRLANKRKAEQGTDEDEKKEVKQREPETYLAGMASVANSEGMVQDAIVMLYKIILDGPEYAPEVREAQFHVADMLYLKKQYSEAAREYQLYVTRYGPAMDTSRNVLGSWKRLAVIDPALERAYEAAIRVAHCWYAQGHRAKMLEAYDWVVRNQDHLNPRVAEALYMTLNARPMDSAEAKRETANALWTRVVNSSMDFGSKGYAKTFMRWVNNSRAVPYVKSATLRAGELYGKIGDHARAAEIFKQYLELYSPMKRHPNENRVLYGRDDQYDVAEYAAGRELIQAGDYESMVLVYQPYIDGLRDNKFRSSALMLMGHFGTEGELYDDARAAYSALLDEYGQPNPLDKEGKPIPVPAAERLRPGTRWNGVRRLPPEDLDPGKIRYALGYLFWKKFDWAGSRRALQPFFDDPGLRNHESCPAALLMLARSNVRLDAFDAAIPVFERLVTDHSGFAAADEAYVGLVRTCYRARNWGKMRAHSAAFTKLRPNAVRRPYVDFYLALAMIETGDATAGHSKLRDLAQAETYGDLKADAHFHLARRALAQSPPDRAAAYKLLRRSIDFYPRAEPLLEAGRCAVELRRWDDARAYLDRCIQEFPESDETILEDARDLLARVVKAEKNGK